MKLQTKIIMSVLGVTLLINILFQVNYIRLQTNVSLENLNTKIQKTNELLSKINSGPIFYYDTNLIETNIKSFMRDPEIKSIHITETSGEIDLFYENSSISNKDTIVVTTSVYYSQEVIGSITTTYTKDVINEKLSDTIRSILLNQLIASIVLFAVILSILKHLIKPIIELTELSYEISNGNLDKEIAIYSNDEIGILSKSFMRMRDSVKEKIQSLYIENEERRKAEVELTKKTNELAQANNELTAHRIHLEELVKQRTSELQDSLDKLEHTKDQLVQSEKMASLGDLVAGVAHEINTPIGVGVTAASHLEGETKSFSKNYKEGKLSKSMFEGYVSMALESSNMILVNLMRAANLIQSFKKVAVDQSSEEKRTFKLKEYIDEIILSIHSKFKHTNYIINVTSQEDVLMDSYPGALSQIITNLALNSLQHGFDGLDEGTIDIQIKKQGNNAVISYSDTGIGIPKEIQKRIFDPFFTTKRGQGGSGLGMNIVYNLITQTLNGTIECSSKPKKGTNFTITIPINIS